MKVTDEMVRRAYESLRSQAAKRSAMAGHAHCYPGGREIRPALEAALAGVPDNSHMAKMAADYEQQLHEAEAKLAKVRAWRDSEEGLNDLPQVTGLDAILGEP